MKISQLNPSQERMPKDTGLSNRIQPNPPIELVNPALDLKNNAYIAQQVNENNPANGAHISQEFRARMDEALAKANEYVASHVNMSSVRFSYHEASGYAFAVVRDTKSGETLRQIPADQFLDLAARMHQASGMMIYVKG